MILPIITAVSPLISKWFDNDSDAEKFKSELAMQLASNEDKLREAQRDIIVAEAKGESWLQRNWRPVLMLICIIIIANNYILAPYVNLFFGADVSLALDENLWTLIHIGVGGYIGSRGVEKTVKTMYADSSKKGN